MKEGMTMGLTLDELREIANATKPKRILNDEEHRIQVDCVKWFRLQYPKLKENLFAVPNGGGRSKAQAGKLKAEGVLSGVSDLILLKSNRYYGALLIEMKTPSKQSKQSEAQRLWQAKMEGEGYKYIVCRSLDDFMKEVNAYLGEL